MTASNTGVFRAYGLPGPAGVVGADYNMSANYWTFFWAYPYAKIFWSLVAFAVVVAVGLHVTRLKDIWSFYRQGE